jgi:hypothetical protein
MVKVTRISTTPANPLNVLVNLEKEIPATETSKASVQIEHHAIHAEPAGDDGPLYVATLEDAIAAKLQEDEGLAKHFTFEPIVDEPKTRRSRGQAPAPSNE